MAGRGGRAEIGNRHAPLLTQIHYKSRIKNMMIALTGGACERERVFKGEFMEAKPVSCLFS